MSLLDQSLAPGQTPLHNMGYDGDAGGVLNNGNNSDLMANMGYDEGAPPPTTPGALSEKGQSTPWHDDYDLPVSVGPVSVSDFYFEVWFWVFEVTKVKVTHSGTSEISLGSKGLNLLDFLRPESNNPSNISSLPLICLHDSCPGFSNSHLPFPFNDLGECFADDRVHD